MRDGWTEYAIAFEICTSTLREERVVRLHAHASIRRAQKVKNPLVQIVCMVGFSAARVKSGQSGPLQNKRRQPMHVLSAMSQMGQSLLERQH